MNEQSCQLLLLPCMYGYIVIGVVIITFLICATVFGIEVYRHSVAESPKHLRVETKEGKRWLQSGIRHCGASGAGLQTNLSHRSVRHEASRVVCQIPQQELPELRASTSVHPVEDRPAVSCREERRADDMLTHETYVVLVHAEEKCIEVAAILKPARPAMVALPSAIDPTDEYVRECEIEYEIESSQQHKAQLNACSVAFKTESSTITKLASQDAMLHSEETNKSWQISACSNSKISSLKNSDGFFFTSDEEVIPANLTEHFEERGIEQPLEDLHQNNKISEARTECGFENVAENVIESTEDKQPLSPEIGPVRMLSALHHKSTVSHSSCEVLEYSSDEECKIESSLQSDIAEIDNKEQQDLYAENKLTRCEAQFDHSFWNEVSCGFKVAETELLAGTSLEVSAISARGLWRASWDAGLCNAWFGWDTRSTNRVDLQLGDKIIVVGTKPGMFLGHCREVNSWFSMPLTLNAVSQDRRQHSESE